MKQRTIALDGYREAETLFKEHITSDYPERFDVQILIYGYIEREFYIRKGRLEYDDHSGISVTSKSCRIRVTLCNERGEMIDRREITCSSASDGLKYQLLDVIVEELQEWNKIKREITISVETYSKYRGFAIERIHNEPETKEVEREHLFLIIIEGIWSRSFRELKESKEWEPYLQEYGNLTETLSG